MNATAPEIKAAIRPIEVVTTGHFQRGLAHILAHSTQWDEQQQQLRSSKANLELNFAGQMAPPSQEKIDKRQAFRNVGTAFFGSEFFVTKVRFRRGLGTCKAEL